MTRVIDISMACSTTKFHYLTDFLSAYYIMMSYFYVLKFSETKFYLVKCGVFVC